MEGLIVVLILFLAPLIALVILGGLVLAVIKMLRGSSSLQAEETRMIQEIYRGISGLEKRVESLETILLGRDRKEEDETRL